MHRALAVTPSPPFCTQLAAAMDVDTPSSANSSASKKRFEAKMWNAVALWAWDIVVDNCAICRNHIMDLCIECQANQASAKSALSHGVSAIMLSTSTASLVGLRLGRGGMRPSWKNGWRDTSLQLLL
uniref:Anaphase-promoting complex subunit 11 RING-H2 finger domain-containing protein n=1 Tax=Chelydra serpentina TaxID=8475 RepID=A0A8C3STE4_CHESE